MPRGFQSIQEEVVHTFSQNSVGSRFLFLPDNYDGNKEPADIAWVCADVALLFYCNANGRSYEKAVKHNIRQAKTWLNKWSDELPLVGKNSSEQFNVHRSSISGIVVLSVVDCPNAGAQIHLDATKKFEREGVVAIATVPETIFKQMASLGASLGDFLALLNFLPKDGSKIEESELRKLFAEANKDIFQILMGVRETEAGRRWTDQFLYTLASVRAGATEGGGRAGNDNIAFVLADIGFREIAWLGAAGFKAVQAVESVPVGKAGVVALSQKFGSRTHGVLAGPLHLLPSQMDRPDLSDVRESGLLFNLIEIKPRVWHSMFAFSHSFAESNISIQIQRIIARRSGNIFTLR